MKTTVLENLNASRLRVTITNVHGTPGTICTLGSFCRDCRRELPASWRKSGPTYIARQIAAFGRCSLNLGRSGMFYINAV